MYSGTQESVNTFFVQLEKMTGLCAPWELAREMGVRLDPTRGEPNPDRVPSSTLGISDVSPLEMAEAYATMANRGVHCASTPILEIRDRNGDVIPTGGPQCNRVLKPAYADAVNDILKGVMEPGGFGQDIALNQPVGRQDRNRRAVVLRLVHRLHAEPGDLRHDRGRPSRR